MEDIDRTFEVLKRIGIRQMIDLLHRERGTGAFIIDPNTFQPRVTKVMKDICESHGWTVEEINEELIKGV
jgi:hypothetical protein